MRTVEPNFAIGLLFAALAVIAVIASRYGHNPYYLAAAAAFALATYTICPPSWMTEIGKRFVAWRIGRK